MLTSVVIPLYNKQRYIGRAVNSVLSQTYQDLELIVVNDGSTDGGPALARAYRDGRIRVIDQTNQGLSAARNRGIAETRGGLIAFLDADDEWLPEFLHTIHRLSKQFPSAGVYITGFRLLKRDGLIYRDMAIRKGEWCGCYFDLHRKGARAHSSAIAIRRRVFNETDPFRIGQHTGQDVDMWFRLATRYEFACSSKICSLYYYYLPDNCCHTTKPARVSGLYLSCLELKKDRDVSPALRRKASRYAAMHMEGQIWRLLQLGIHDTAQARLAEYRHLFGRTAKYCVLSSLHLIPSAWCVSIGRARMRAAEWVLSLRSKPTLAACFGSLAHISCRDDVRR
jgi:glycosyltransferase involved in cell wall biosynthesis